MLQKVYDQHACTPILRSKLNVKNRKFLLRKIIPKNSRKITKQQQKKNTSKYMTFT